MEGLKKQLSDDLKSALKKGEALRVSTLRMVSSSIANKEIELRKRDIGLSNQEVLDVISSEAKKRKDAAEGFKKGGRAELAEKEMEELSILKTYLPPEISDEDLLRIIKDGIREAGTTDVKDFAKVMKVIMPTLKGKASGDRISRALKSELEKND
ncbi:hypothetical protein A2W54_04020 [Candidatus Giovannonibacteria bacterium RIFCSPHIGHO2_02_43_13]|uniref:Glutamyl-tRNA amidotransferase n=1 Tax=Candidatus Giovannonibacteria bacterium RIFCSPHIGHO2_02_43_13 TaxID=1798330 RepID=A0A1F5WS35_9BACT|nr:MAG: hypothetical protein UW28_C0029G0012 [Parcubacteria group bacterium GW2011_GWA2_44_13]OGF73293.1 MAG: hypothetical protein A3E06_03360 [Candidatus Giovannonibacteria bacterium RIFCSPHIGHO2_12_FULL_44_42]OGF78485.1 MAG: hypothetical protein A2W54_04020 [Candidatus Giovannonibacteria bacterium RIFCSPHIGHO2_02_43_13]OGF89267.1 MAG: hypothetical protein A3I94_02885 [Candidatus Giovannonibacteria bacterium RIFCSPLOWO2_02_FULL_43_54]OGF97452.1 MAG: hypothetical protein A3H08_02685 [Candidatus